MQGQSPSREGGQPGMVPYPSREEDMRGSPVWVQHLSGLRAYPGGGAKGIPLVGSSA